jgi:hypothetical protein
MNIGCDDDNPTFLPEEKQTLFSIVKNEEEKANIYHLEDLADHIEQYAIKENDDLKVEEKFDEEYDLENVKNPLINFLLTKIGRFWFRV